MIKKKFYFDNSWSNLSRARLRLCFLLLSSFGICCVGAETHAYDPSSVNRMGFEWLYYLNNATEFDLLIDGALVKGNRAALPSGATMDLQNVSCQGKGKDLSCLNNNLADCIRTSMCSLNHRKTLFQGGVVTLPGVFSVKPVSGKAPKKIKVQLKINKSGKGQILEVLKAPSN